MAKKKTAAKQPPKRKTATKKKAVKRPPVRTLATLTTDEFDETIRRAVQSGRAAVAVFTRDVTTEGPVICCDLWQSDFAASDGDRAVCAQTLADAMSNI